MSTIRSRRSVLPLAAALIALLSTAAPAAAVPFSWDFGGWFRGVLSSLWGHSGCDLDPSGRCGAAPAPVESGCGWDPDGRCGAAPAPAQWLSAPSGCALDPNGRCRTAPAPIESGCAADPDGRCRQ